MENFDLFDITGLAFDSIDSITPQKVQNALKKAKKDTEGLLGGVTQTEERKQINEKLAFIAQMQKELFTTDDKLTPKLAELAQVRTETAKKKLENRIKLEELQGKEKVITSGKLKQLRKSTKLSEKSITDVYTAHGFQIVKIDPLAAYPKFPSNAERIYKDLATLRASHDPNPKGADLTKVTDLYAFAAYICGEPEHAAEYRGMTSDKLSALLDDYAKKNAMRNDNLGKLCVSIATAGKMYVFNNDDNQLAYEKHLQYKDPGLQELFATLKDTPKDQLLDPTFAEVCIKIIAGVFGDSDTSLAIYNREAGLQDDPYLGASTPTHLVKCAYCHNLSTFTTRKEAQEKNKCEHCGKPLFKTCPKCKEFVLLSDDRCPACNYQFASIALFNKYIGMVEIALNNGDYVAAQENLVKAESADPSERTRTGALRARIEHELGIHKEHLQKIDSFMGQRKYQAASDYISRVVIPQDPSLNISAKQAEIQSVLARCRQRFASVGSAGKAQKVNACLDICDECVDFAPALEFLHSQAAVPDPVSAVDYSSDDDKGTITITWRGSSERGVKYFLVRKAGKTPPKNQNDGTILLRGTSELIYQDNSVETGSMYGYSVFAERFGVYSLAKSLVAGVFVKVSHVRYEQRGKALQISWVAPPQCVAVEVRRLSAGQTQVLSASARNSYEDTNLEYDVPYSYGLIATYPNGKSAAYSFAYTPTVEIRSFNISVARQGNGVYEVQWTIQEPGIDLQVLANKKVITTTTSGARSTRISLSENSFYTISAQAFSGGTWLPSANTVTINTLRPCKIDVDATHISESTIRKANGTGQRIEFEFHLENDIPSQATGLLYFVRTKPNQSSSAPWVSPQELDKTADGQRVDISTYKNTGAIRYSMEARAEEAYYITVFTLYSVNGRQIISDPYKKKLNRPLDAEVYWKIAKPLFGEQQLQITVQSNRPITRRPRLVLRASDTGRMLLSPTDSCATRIMDIPERYLESSQTEFKETFLLKEKIAKNTKVFLFEVEPVTGEKFSLRWATGFEGKV
jgi:hypothetical protein